MGRLFVLIADKYLIRKAHNNIRGRLWYIMIYDGICLLQKENQEYIDLFTAPQEY